MNVSLHTGVQYQVAVAKKAQASVKELNQGALDLIQSAAAPAAASPAATAPVSSVGTRLDVRA